MPVRLSIGDFARMTYLSIKSLRRYHDMGLLVPAEVDTASGYRYYDSSQVTCTHSSTRPGRADRAGRRAVRERVLRRGRGRGGGVRPGEQGRPPGRWRGRTGAGPDHPRRRTRRHPARGALGELDLTYGALGTFVSEREIGVPGPIREHYLMTGAHSADESQHRTEVCWPVFHLRGEER
jgi:hypothetical protein